jgi:hypothetical protein
MVIQQDKLTILFAILYWGLGHASRSIPIIKELLDEGYNVVVCTDGPVVTFLEKELKANHDLNYEYLPPYNISYKSDSMVWNITTQLPTIYNAYRKEKRTFKQLVSKHRPVACFSDNRYGCLVSSVPCFFIGHQWNILGSKGENLGLPSKINQQFIRKFDAMLIPDDENIKLSKKLSADNSAFKRYFIGIQSRFETLTKSSAKAYKFIAILSGPEPARTRFENQVLVLFKNRHQRNPNESFTLIRGTNSDIDSRIPPFINIYSLADSQQILTSVGQAEWVIARSGYSSLMDFYRLGLSKVILVPTPGQTEQEYLASTIDIRGFHSIEQSKLSIKTIDAILSQTQNTASIDDSLRKKEINSFTEVWQTLQTIFAISKPIKT